ncbi:TlpA family protein disulfide reductase [Flavobacterium amniphilum]|uniref:TlpA family protein disulfide reductase n=1 Tax=Flavobacterium amniphilum TaxID=1834035 RepID=UPI00202A830B|nr:TlpA disulfide reductase family protein [Flavobacterium amniphilum]MCL9804448.1 TlpA family protein disulfide reductase [Flavobacterium amniphilum]
MKNIRYMFLLSLLFGFTTYAQGTYYKLNDNQTLNQIEYGNLEKAMRASGITPKIVKTQERNDSIIKTIGLFDSKTEANYDKFREGIGTSFKIEKFKDKSGNYYSHDYLKNKPTVVHFWFTTCTPCVAEIPNLNIMKARFNDSVNFIAITFEKEKLVTDFLKTRPINFEHIVNSQKQLDQLDIKYYPMTLLLDKDGKIVEVYSQIKLFDEEINSKLKSLL